MKMIDHSFFVGFTTKNVELLRETVRNALAMDGNQCILHPLGFYLIRLHTKEDVSFRLHYWPGWQHEHGSAITPYHDHVWSLCSCVLAGAVENVLLELDPDELGNFQVANINQVGNVDEVIPVLSRVSIRVQSRETYRTGEFYEIAPRVFHYTNVPVGEAALTLVQATLMVSGGPRTLVPIGNYGHTPSREPIESSEHVFKEISQLLDKLYK